MVDPVGTISLGITVVSALVAYYNKCKDRDLDLNATLDSLNSLNESLILLRGTVPLPSSQQNGVADNAAQVQVAKSVISCTGGVKQLEKKLNKIKSWDMPRSEDSVREKFGRQYQKAAYPFRAGTLGKLRDIVSDLRANLGIAIQIAQYKESQGLIEGVRRLNNRQEDEEKKAILEWLSVGDHDKQQIDLSNQRQGGTGEWFVHCAEFQQLRHGENDSKTILFCPGMPGAGKTFIASAAIEYLQSTALKGTTAVGVCFIYCNYKKQQEHRLDLFLASMLRQLIRGLGDVPESVRRLSQNKKMKESLPSVAESLNAFKVVAREYARVFVLIDALDECSNEDGVRYQLLDKILELQSLVPSVGLLVTSRPIPEISEKFHGGLQREIYADEGDLQKYIAARIPHLSSCVRSRADLQENVLLGVISAVQGMYVVHKCWPL